MIKQIPNLLMMLRNKICQKVFHDLMIFWALLLCVSSAQAAWYPDLECKGKDPIWILSIWDTTAQFRFNEQTIDFDIVDTTIGQPGPWPIALTLLAPRDTAIVILRMADEFEVDILTQHRDLPVLFSGECDVQ